MCFIASSKPLTILIEIIGSKYSVDQSSSVALFAEIVLRVLLHALTSTPCSLNSLTIFGKNFWAISSETRRVSIAPQIPYL